MRHIAYLIIMENSHKITTVKNTAMPGITLENVIQT